MSSYRNKNITKRVRIFTWKWIVATQYKTKLRSQWLTAWFSLSTTVVFQGQKPKLALNIQKWNRRTAWTTSRKRNQTWKVVKVSLNNFLQDQRLLLVIMREALYVTLSYFFQLQMSRRGRTAVFLTKRQRVLRTRPLKRKIKLAQVRVEYYIY